LKLLSKQNIVFFCIIGVIFVVSVIVWLVVSDIQTENTTALVYKNGVLIETISLSAVETEYEYAINDDGVNVILVKSGEIGVISADCPTQICVNTGFIGSGVIPIICIPNRLEIRIVGGSHELDAVAG
jgi:hypothetical protein